MEWCCRTGTTNEPTELTAFGLVEHRREVFQMLPAGGISDFNEFLELLSAGGNTDFGVTQKMQKVRPQLLWIFKKFMQGKIGDELLSFPLRVSAYLLWNAFAFLFVETFFG